MDHVREHRSLCAYAGKRLLVPIARRLPMWLTSDHLTPLGCPRWAPQAWRFGHPRHSQGAPCLMTGAAPSSSAA
jgi:hypothetical protein